MHNEVWSRTEIDSPCVRICVVHREANICIGCYRTPGEIAAWSRMQPQERREIMAELKAREPLLRGKRRGRAGRISEQSE